MLTNAEIKNLIQESLNGLYQSGIIEKEITAEDDTVLLGADSELDSIAFVTLFIDIEDRISTKMGGDFYLAIDNIHAFNPVKTYLTFEVLVNYIEKTLN